MRAVLLASCVAVGLWCWTAGSARACRFESNPLHEVDTESTDTTPPSEPMIADSRIVRRPEDGGCGGTRSSCDGIGTIQIRVTAEDDATPLDRMGFRLDVLEGDAPALFPGAVRTIGSDLLQITFTDEGQDVHFRVAITAVDEAGNLSPTSAEVTVADSGGCAVGAARSTAALWPALLVLFVLAVRSVRARRWE